VVATPESLIFLLCVVERADAKGHGLLSDFEIHDLQYGGLETAGQHHEEYLS
jgi:hypothetical protein